MEKLYKNTLKTYLFYKINSCMHVEPLKTSLHIIGRLKSPTAEEGGNSNGGKKINKGMVRI